MDVQELVDLLKARLNKPKPGIQAQLEMSPEPRPGHKAYEEVDDSCPLAGVLVLFYLRDQQLHLLLTRRTDRVLHHRNQISFPGGQQEPDEDIQRTALREAEEELGLVPGDVQILGELTPLYIAPSNFCIYPTVAFMAERPHFQPHPEEVAEVLEVPWGHLTNTENQKKEMWTLRGHEILVPFFCFHENKIWGATAMVLAELLSLIGDFPLRNTRIDT